MRRTSSADPPATPPPAPPGGAHGARQVHFTQDEDSGDWTLNTPAIKVLPAEVTDLPSDALARDGSSPDLLGGGPPPPADSGPGIAGGPHSPRPAPTQAQAPAPGPEVMGGSAAVMRQPEPLQMPRPDPVTLPNALKGQRPHPIADETTGDDPLIGTIIGDRYVVDDVLGEGGMGKVYLAHHKVIGKKLAIKVLHAELVKDKEAVGRFVREAKAASSIGNPHIVDISDFGETPDGSTYFVMEYLDGFTLGDLLEERHALPVPLALEIALQLTDGLAAAHAQEIVHRDLKPENVTIIQRGQQQHFCKILDFGIAKVSTRVTTEKLTMAGAVFGTPHYMSPEQAAGAAVDHRTDVYSLGVMLYEMVSGELPFNADNFMGILTQHMYKAPVPIRALASAPDCPPGLEAIILKCLSKKPEGRYENMSELAADLQLLHSGQIPTAVHEMMARSGSFNVPADYFKRGDAMVPATPAPPAQQRLGLKLAIAALALLVGAVALAVVFRDGLTSTPAPTASESAAATADTPPPATAASATVPTADEAALRHVLIAAEPVESEAFVDGIRVELPASVPVPVGQTVTVEVKLDGYEPQSIVLDGSEQRKTIKLDKKKRTGAPRIIRRPKPRPATKPTQPKPGSGSSEVVDPWAQK